MVADGNLDWLMARPLSRPDEIGRAIGYNVDIDLLLEKLKRASLGQWDHLKHNDGFLEQVGRAAEGQMAGPESEPASRLWVVVKIERGVPVMIDAYPNKRSATRREKFLRRHMRIETDDVALLEIKL